MESTETQDKTQTEQESYLSLWQADVLNQTRLRPLHLDYGHFYMS